jgi:hypothetical protein
MITMTEWEKLSHLVEGWVDAMQERTWVASHSTKAQEYVDACVIEQAARAAFYAFTTSLVLHTAEEN